MFTILKQILSANNNWKNNNRSWAAACNVGIHHARVCSQMVVVWFVPGTIHTRHACIPTCTSRASTRNFHMWFISCTIFVIPSFDFALDSHASVKTSSRTNCHIGILDRQFNVWLTHKCIVASTYIAIPTYTHFLSRSHLNHRCRRV